MKARCLLFLFFLLIIGQKAFPQQDSAFNMVDTLLIKSGIKNPFKINFFNAGELIISENWPEAIKILVELAKEQPDNYNVHFKLGFCYLKTKLEKHKAIQYLERAVQGASLEYYPDDLDERQAPYESFYYLGQAYHLNYQFQEAIDTLNYLLMLVPSDDLELIQNIKTLSKYCEDGIKIEKNSLPIILTHMGFGINTVYDEHSPVFPEDESFLVFTSRRKGSTGELTMEDGSFYEDIYLSQNKEGVWSEPKKIDRINTPYNEASIGLSPDGKTMFIYRSEGENGDIYVSKIESDGFWGTPEKMPAPINSRSRETHASVDSEGNTMYFTSDRNGGFGGTDIYVVKKLPTGEWGKALNLGAKINTPLDEEAPHTLPDGKTMYFSSQGHKTMGGFDIFSSTMNDDGTWNDPENVGYPINTTEDDAFYFPSADGRTAYYSTHNTGGFGLSDIFRITLPSSEENDLAAITGIVNLDDGKKSSVEISVFDFNNGKLIGKYSPNLNTGKYIFILSPGNTYKVVYSANGYYNHSENVYVAKKETYQEINKTVTLFSKKNPAPIPEKRDTIHISDMLFEFDKNDGNTENLDELSRFLKENPKAIIEIGGHADANGPEIYNIHLSLRRAIFVYNYLRNKGVNKEQMVVKGYGEKYPLLPEEIPDGAQFEDLHKFNRRVEFKVLREGKEALFVANIKVPDEFMKKTSEVIKEKAILADRDRDGIPDVDDECPDEKGVAENKGCPEITEEVIKIMAEAMEGLLFQSGSSIIDDRSFDVLDNVARIMKENADFRLSIAGHTDNSGAESMNLDLSRARAQAAKDYLIEKGIDRNRIESAGFGSSQPVTTNDTDIGRKQNRRVEFKIVF